MVRSHVGVLFLLAGAAGLVAAEPAVTDLVPSAVARKMGPPYYSGAVLPTPREAEYRDEYVELIDGPAGEWRCRIVHDYGGPARELMERLLQRRVAQYTSQFPDLEGPPAPGAVPVRFVLLSDPAAAPHLERHGLQQRAKTLQPQGYLLEITPQEILCAGHDDAGLANGLASLLQLTHVRGDKLVVRCAGVRDWPTFRIRYTAEYHLPGPDFFDWMMLYKINGFGACYRGMRWEGLTEPKREGLRAIGEYISAYRTMHFMVQFHIGGRGGRAVDCGDPADVERLLQTIGETLELSHAQHVMICYDDVRPELQPEQNSGDTLRISAGACPVAARRTAEVGLGRGGTGRRWR